MTHTYREDTVTTRITINHKGLSLKWDIEDEDEADKTASTIVDILNGNRPTRPRRRFTQEQLQEIAKAWHAAPEGGRNKAIRELLDVTSQDATNYIHRCRAVGLIPPVERRTRGAKKYDTSTIAEQSFDDQFGADIVALMNRGAEG